MSKTIVVTGGAGFIGSHFVESLRTKLAVGDKIFVIDKMGAGSSESNKIHSTNITYHINNLCDIKSLDALVRGEIDAIVHFAAESHVDRSITSPTGFYANNVLGIMPLLEYVRGNPKCMLFNVSTDEVYGSLKLGEDPWTEASPLKPRSPYSASKAACDMLCESYKHTYNIKHLTTRCSNNFGARQDDEKFIPTVVRNIVNGTPIPIYGSGNNRREWMPVEQHVEVIMERLIRWLGSGDDFLSTGVYNVSGGKELSNMELVNKIHAITSERGYRTTMEYVTDRKGHDFRYAMKGADNYRYHFDKYLLNTVVHYINKYEQIKEQLQS